MTNSDSKLFNPNVSFFRLAIVWSTLFFIVGLSLLLIAIANYGTNYQLCSSTDCYNNFITQFKLPLGILSLLIPLGAIYAVQHRSEQSLAQIKTSEGQNNFVNYYKHLEEFEKYLKSKAIDTKVYVNQTHAEIFQGSRDGDFNILNSTQELIANKYLEIYIMLKNIEKMDIEDIEQNKAIDKNFKGIESKINELNNKLNVIPKKLTLKSIIVSPLKIVDINAQINYVRRETLQLITLLSFCHTYTPAANMKAISNLASKVDFTEVQNCKYLNF